MTQTDKDTSMNAFGFVQIVESYGGSAVRWPQSSRQSALDFAASHPTAQQIRESAVKLDAALDTVIAPPASDVLRARILKALRETPAAQVIKAANDRLPYRAIAATLVVSGFLGFFGGGIPQLSTPAAYAETLDTNMEVNSFDEQVSYAWIEDTLYSEAGE